MEHYYQPDIECASREQITAWQNERLVKQVHHVYKNVPYYRQKMDAKGVTPEDIQSIGDLHKLPFLTKEDLRNAYPYGLLGTPLKDAVAFSPQAVRPDAVWLPFTPSMISTSGKTAARERLWRQAEPMRTLYT